MNRSDLLKKREQFFYPNVTHYYQEPLLLVKAKGSYAWDEKDQQYLDFIGGIVTISVGHNHPRIQDRLKNAIDSDSIQHTTTLYLNQAAPDLCEAIAKRTPQGACQAVYLTNSGSEANEMAILTARQATGRSTIVALRHAYHGGTQATLNLCGHANWKFSHQPQCDVVHAVEPNCYRCPFGKTKNNCSLECAEDVKKTIDTTTSGQVAAIIIEPIMGVGGFIDPPTDYHQRVAEIIHSYGGLYISDEVQTGVGRTGKNFFAIEDSGVTPDLITMAKGLGNGAPIGAVAAKKEHAMHLKGKTHFNTFGGDPYQSLQALEVLAIVDEEKCLENTHQQGTYLKQQLLALQKDFSLMGDIRGRGLMIGIECVKDPLTKEPAPKETAQLMENCRKEGLLLGKGGLFGNVLRVVPPLNVTRLQIDEFITKFKAALIKLK